MFAGAERGKSKSRNERLALLVQAVCVLSKQANPRVSGRSNQANPKAIRAFIRLGIVSFDSLLQAALDKRFIRQVKLEHDNGFSVFYETTVKGVAFVSMTAGKTDAEIIADARSQVRTELTMLHLRFRS